MNFPGCHRLSWLQPILRLICSPSRLCVYRSVSIYSGLAACWKQRNGVYSDLNYRVHGNHFIPVLLLSLWVSCLDPSFITKVDFLHQRHTLLLRYHHCRDPRPSLVIQRLCEIWRMPRNFSLYRPLSAPFDLAKLFLVVSVLTVKCKWRLKWPNLK